MLNPIAMTVSVTYVCCTMWLVVVQSSSAHDITDTAVTLSSRRTDYENQLAAAMLMAAEQAGAAQHELEHDVEGRKPSEICYNELGCFKKHPVGALPEHPDTIQPLFRLFIKESKSAVNVYYYNSTFGDEVEVTKNALNDKSRELVFVTHGFGGNGILDWIQEIARVKTQRYNSNVIVVDWEYAARYSTLYMAAAANSALIGRMAALFCLRLTKHYDISLAQVQFVGFSLGAQVAGFFSTKIFEDSGVKIGKVTALDTAAPLFEPAGVFPRKEHTNFLEAVHTSAGNVIWRGKLGIQANYGHVDYYPNGGIDQPGCKFPNLGCAHQRAVEYYLEALKSKDRCRYHGFPCPSVNEAQVGLCGLIMDRRHYMSMDRRRIESAAILYLRTNSTPPYCLPDDY